MVDEESKISEQFHRSLSLLARSTRFRTRIATARLNIFQFNRFIGNSVKSNSPVRESKLPARIEIDRKEGTPGARAG